MAEYLALRLLRVDERSLQCPILPSLEDVVLERTNIFALKYP